LVCDGMQEVLAYADWCLSLMTLVRSVMAATEAEQNVWVGDAKSEGMLRRQSSSAGAGTERSMYPERPAKTWA